jgi:diketogulonate reductase-like aldo/keto reductase
MRRREPNGDDRLEFFIDMGLKVVYDAIKIGYRLLDGACDYANEKEAGEGVRRAIKDGLVKREDLCEFPSHLA